MKVGFNDGMGVLRAWTCLYTKLMYLVEKAYPEVDFSTITRGYIYANDLPCISIKKAVEAGLLKTVKGWENLVSELQGKHGKCWVD